jgi:hypothetical protein
MVVEDILGVRPCLDEVVLRRGRFD